MNLKKPAIRFLYIFIVFIMISLYFFVGLFTHAEDISSTNFRIEGDNLSSGSGTGDSTNFGLTADVNPFSDLSDSSNFRQELGYNPRIQAFTPFAPTLDNPFNYYDRLRIIIDSSNNPTDTLFAVIVTQDDWASYKYLQSDNTLDTTLGAEDYRTYASLGGASGVTILGLKPDTPHKARVKALNGDFTETGYGPESAEVLTTVPFINFQLDTSVLTLGVLNLNSISQTSSVTITVNTNAMSGYQVYVNDTGDGANGGLYDGFANLILSADATLFAGTAGYGAQGNSISATVDAKYDLSGDNVGALTVGTNPIFSNSAAVTDETSTILFKAAISGSTIAGDYSDVIYYTITPIL